MDNAILRRFSELPLQGPGSDSETIRVLRLVASELSSKPIIADFGCGTGRSTLVLAETVKAATITALDTASVFIDVLRTRVQDLGLDSRVRPVVGNMLSPPIAPRTLDLVGSEGTAYAVGLAAALQVWQPLIHDEGRCVVSECEWLSGDRPPSVEAFWRENYPDMGDRDENVRRAQAAGFEVLATHVLSDEGWDAYYGALTSALATVPKGTIQPWFASGIAREIEIRRLGQHCFGYVFYVLRPRRR